MALKIRLRQQGRTNHATYRLVVTDTRHPRDGKYVEKLGWYNPKGNVAEQELSLNGERIAHWMSLGAQLSDKAEQLVARLFPAILHKKQATEQAKRAKLTAKRRERRRAKAAAGQ